jgi:hypothetical protein
MFIFIRILFSSTYAACFVITVLTSLALTLHREEGRKESIFISDAEKAREGKGGREISLFTR